MTALAYVPDAVPELHAQTLHMPCSVDQATSAVARGRPGNPAILAIFVATPAWSQGRLTVLFDCRRIEQSVFACAVFPSLTREAIILAAGRGAREQFAVYVHSLLQPLEPGQRISLTSSMLISLVRGCGVWPPVAHDLADRLHDRDGWDADPVIPGPPAIPGQHFWVLTDTTVGTARDIPIRTSGCLLRSLVSLSSLTPPLPCL